MASSPLGLRPADSAVGSANGCILLFRWESVTVTRTPAATPPSRSPWLHRALATVVEALGPPAAELVAATAWRVLNRGHGTREVVLSPHRPQLPGATRALPRPDHAS